MILSDEEKLAIKQRQHKRLAGLVITLDILLALILSIEILLIIFKALGII